MQYETLRNINQIIERDSKDTTYKFALLRATIEVISYETPYSYFKDDRVELPIGLLVLKWIEYYYPIVENKLPQKKDFQSSGREIAIKPFIEKIINLYSKKGGLPVFYNDLVKGNVPIGFEDEACELCREIRNTIKKQPMKYIGKSVFKENYGLYEVSRKGKPFYKTRGTKYNLDAQYLIERCGYFSIPIEYYQAFEFLGSFITGNRSILLNWASFTADKSNSEIKLSDVLPIIMTSPLTERKVTYSRSLYLGLIKQNGRVECVWSGRDVESDKLEVDHLIPFSIWRNNDLWNLLPTDAKVNNDKSDSIPSPELLNKKKDIILYYWDYCRNSDVSLFDQELNINLIDKNRIKSSNWENEAFNSLVETCSYLIETRGFEAFNL
jgi:hypothetical protein